MCVCFNIEKDASFISCSNSSNSSNLNLTPAFFLFFAILEFKKRETEVYVGNLPLDISEVCLTLCMVASHLLWLPPYDLNLPVRILPVLKGILELRICRQSLVGD